MGRLVLGLAMVLAGSGCGGAQPKAAPPDLTGEWVFDAARTERLSVVTRAPEGPERERAIARAKADMKDLRVVFTADEATLHTSAAIRTVPYRVLSWHGPIIELQTVQADRTVTSSVHLEHERLTWFDGEGGIEFVLRRPEACDGGGCGGSTGG